MYSARWCIQLPRLAFKQLLENEGLAYPNSLGTKDFVVVVVVLENEGLQVFLFPAMVLFLNFAGVQVISVDAYWGHWCITVTVSELHSCGFSVCEFQKSFRKCIWTTSAEMNDFTALFQKMYCHYNLNLHYWICSYAWGWSEAGVCVCRD